MKTFTTTLIAMMILVGCGTDEKDLGAYKDQRLEDLRLEFINDCFKYGDERCLKSFPNNEIFAVKKDSLDRKELSVAGLCEPYVGSSAVYIDEQFLGNRDYLRLLVYHELGHCLLDARHNSSDIMYQEVTPYQQKINNQEWRNEVQDLFYYNP